MTSINFLCFLVSLDGIKPTKDKTEELKSFSYPNDSKGLRRFLGMVGFYRKLIPNFSEIVLPLSGRMRQSPKGPFISNESEKQAFRFLIRELSDVSAFATVILIVQIIISH